MKLSKDTLKLKDERVTKLTTSILGLGLYES